jgi:Protein of unknown function (DUF1016).
MTRLAVAPAALFAQIRDILEGCPCERRTHGQHDQGGHQWMIGREIVEAEQGGKQRADYGTRLLAGLSARMTQEFGRGWSADNLEAFLQFYLLYPKLIAETASRQSVAPAIRDGVSEMGFRGAAILAARPAPSRAVVEPLPRAAARGPAGGPCLRRRRIDWTCSIMERKVDKWRCLE